MSTIHRLLACGIVFLAQAAIPAMTTSPSAGLEVAPRVFAPGVVSGPDHDSAPAFTRDGGTVYFGRSDGLRSWIMMSRLTAGRWQMPIRAPFSGAWNDLEPTMSPDGRSLFFVSNRPAPGGVAPIDGTYNKEFHKARGGNIWKMTRKGDVWSEPVRLPDVVNSSTSTFAPSVARNGNLYFMRPANDPIGRFQLFRARLVHGLYEKPIALDFSDGSVTNVDEAVSPDERFMVFGGGFDPQLQMELYLSVRHGGHWTRPMHIDGPVSAPGSDAEVRLSHDARTVYFSSERKAPGTVADWNNGRYNIWSFPIAPWLRKARREASAHDVNNVSGLLGGSSPAPASAPRPQYGRPGPAAA